MQVFQSAASGYRDPAKSMTIKALEQRLKAAQEQAASASQMTQPIADPMQGYAYLGNILASGINEARAQGASASARDQLAKIKAQIDWKTGMTGDQYAQASILDPEWADKTNQDFIDYRQEMEKQAKQQEFTTSERLGSQGFQAGQQEDQQAAAVELAVKNQQMDTEEAQRQEQQKIDAIGLETAARKAEAEKLGMIPGTPEYNAYVARNAGPPAAGQKIEVNTGANNSKFVERSDTTAADRMDTIVKQGQSVPAFMSQIEQLRDIGRQVGTGKGTELAAKYGPWAELLGVKIEGLGNMQAFNSIAAAMAPKMRIEGSGTMSDFDARQLLSSLPHIGNDPRGNEIIANTFKSIADHQLKSADIARKAQRGLISWQDAEQEIAAIPYPYEAFKEYMKESNAFLQANPAGAGGGAPAARPGVRVEEIPD